MSANIIYLGIHNIIIHTLSTSAYCMQFEYIYTVFINIYICIYIYVSLLGIEQIL